ncbi:MAG TPA: alpha/beta hydrolase [Vicinamibacteria bacterium]|nr:alpha/beta hydrolase [Vicinamibacteria bacterium]
MRSNSRATRTLGLVASFLLPAALARGLPEDERVELESNGWRLVGEWRPAESDTELAPAALLLHRAAGSRAEYQELAEELAKRGVASLRLDLRGNGESDNLGRFEEPYEENLRILEKTYEDIHVALRWISARPGIDSDRRAAVGASYSGEAIAEALRQGGERIAAYVILSPGSFSDESIAAVDASGVPWLFIRTSEESEVSREFIDAIFEALASQSKSAEVRVIEGAGHATRIFDEHPFIIEEIAEWLAERLGAEP